MIVSSFHIVHHFGSMQPLADAVRDGRILGIVYMVGCNNPNGEYASLK